MPIVIREMTYINSEISETENNKTHFGSVSIILAEIANADLTDFMYLQTWAP